MRLCLFTSLGLLLTACGLSMNPDLPSTREGGESNFGSPPSEGSDGDDGGIPVVGDGDALQPAPDLPSGAGGTAQRCLGPGGAGGAWLCGEEVP